MMLPIPGGIFGCLQSSSWGLSSIFPHPKTFGKAGAALGQELAPGIIDGCMSPRIFYKLHKHAERIAACVNDCDMPKFENKVPRNSDEMTGQVMGWQCIPAEVCGEEVYKRSVQEFCSWLVRGSRLDFLASSAGAATDSCC